MPSPILLILTVGTGTAGKHSNLAAGLSRTVELIGPRKFWLIPSIDEVSRLTADLIREPFPERFVRWSDAEPYAVITRPDSLENSRETVRQVIAHARSQLAKNERLIVNPTSGTKQMSSGATIAALDEHVGELVFTIGERADGVVRTGTERLETFDASGYFAEHSFHQATALFETGAFQAAADLLATGNAFPTEAALCRCLHEWERLDYPAALARARTSGEFPGSLLPTLRQLAEDSAKPWPSPAIVADLLRSARHLQGIRDYEQSITRACKALEMGLRLDLNRRTHLYEPYPAAQLLKLPGLPSPLLDRLAARQRGSSLFIGLRDLIDVLAALGSPLAATYLAPGSGTRRAVEIRNTLTHQLRSTTPAEAHDAIRAVDQLLRSLDLPAPSVFPTKLLNP